MAIAPGFPIQLLVCVRVSVKQRWTGGMGRKMLAAIWLREMCYFHTELLLNGSPTSMGVKECKVNLVLIKLKASHRWAEKLYARWFN